MRALATTSLLTILAFSLGLSIQDPAEPPVAEKPMARHQREEKERLEGELEGAWILVHFQNPTIEVAQEDIQGFAIFHGGFLSITMQARTFEPEFLGPGIQHYVHAGAFRYRISELLELQTAAILGFTNVSAGDELAFEPAGFPRRYGLTLSEDELRMEREDHAVFVFRRVTDARFPARSLEYLSRGGGEWEVGED